MNAQPKQVDALQDEAYAVPQIKKLLMQRRQAQQDLIRYEQGETIEAQKFLAAEGSRMANTDQTRIPELRRVAKEAEDRLADAKESRRVADARLKDISSQIDAAVDRFHAEQFEKKLNAYRSENSQLLERRRALEREDMALHQRYLAELHKHNNSYPPAIDYGDPRNYVGNGTDILQRKVIANVDIGDTRTVFEFAKT